MLNDLYYGYSLLFFSSRRLMVLKEEGMDWRYGHLQGGPQKNGTANFPQYVDAITGLSV